MYLFDENFWIAISFIIFLYFAYKPVKKAIIDSLDSKINDIKKNLAQSEKAKEEAKLLLKKVQQDIETFKAYKQEAIDKATESTERIIKKKAKEMEISLERKRESANQMIENEKAKISETLKNEFTDAVITTVKNYLAESKNNSISDEEIVNKFIK